MWLVSGACHCFGCVQTSDRMYLRIENGLIWTSRVSARFADRVKDLSFRFGERKCRLSPFLQANSKSHHIRIVVKITALVFSHYDLVWNRGLIYHHK